MTGLSRLKITIHNRGMYLTSSTNFHGSFSFQLAPPETPPPELDNNDSGYVNVSIHGYILDASFKESLKSEECLGDYQQSVEAGTILGLGTLK